MHKRDSGKKDDDGPNGRKKEGGKQNGKNKGDGIFKLVAKETLRHVSNPHLLVGERNYYHMSKTFKGIGDKGRAIEFTQQQAMENPKLARSALKHGSELDNRTILELINRHYGHKDFATTPQQLDELLKNSSAISIEFLLQNESFAPELIYIHVSINVLRDNGRCIAKPLLTKEQFLKSYYLHFNILQNQFWPVIESMVKENVEEFDRLIDIALKDQGIARNVLSSESIVKDLSVEQLAKIVSAYVKEPGVVDDAEGFYAFFTKQLQAMRQELFNNDALSQLILIDNFDISKHLSPVGCLMIHDPNAGALLTKNPALLSTLTIFDVVILVQKYELYDDVRLPCLQLVAQLPLPDKASCLEGEVECTNYIYKSLLENPMLRSTFPLQRQVALFSQFCEIAQPKVKELPLWLVEPLFKNDGVAVHVFEFENIINIITEVNILNLLCKMNNAVYQQKLLSKLNPQWLSQQLVDHTHITSRLLVTHPHLLQNLSIPNRLEFIKERQRFFVAHFSEIINIKVPLKDEEKAAIKNAIDSLNIAALLNLLKSNLKNLPDGQCGQLGDFLIDCGFDISGKVRESNELRDFLFSNFELGIILLDENIFAIYFENLQDHNFTSRYKDVIYKSLLENKQYAILFFSNQKYVGNFHLTRDKMIELSKRHGEEINSLELFKEFNNQGLIADLVAYLKRCEAQEATYPRKVVRYPVTDKIMDNLLSGKFNYNANEIMNILSDGIQFNRLYNNEIKLKLILTYAAKTPNFLKFVDGGFMGPYQRNIGMDRSPVTQEIDKRQLTLQSMMLDETHGYGNTIKLLESKSIFNYLCENVFSSLTNDMLETLYQKYFLLENYSEFDFQLLGISKTDDDQTISTAYKRCRAKYENEHDKLRDISSAFNRIIDFISTRLRIQQIVEQRDGLEYKQKQQYRFWEPVVIHTTPRRTNSRTSSSGSDDSDESLYNSVTASATNLFNKFK